MGILIFQIGPISVCVYPDRTSLFIEAVNVCLCCRLAHTQAWCMCVYMGVGVGICVYVYTLASLM